MAARLGGECMKHRYATTKCVRDDFGTACETFFAPIEAVFRSESPTLQSFPKHESVHRRSRPTGRRGPGGRPGRRELASNDGKGDPQFNIRVGSMTWQRANQVTSMFVLSCKSSATESYSQNWLSFASTPIVNIFSGKDSPMRLKEIANNSNNAILFSRTTNWPPLKTVSLSRIKRAKKYHALFALSEKIKFHSGRKKWCAN